MRTVVVGGVPAGNVPAFDLADRDRLAAPAALLVNGPDVIAAARQPGSRGGAPGRRGLYAALMHALDMDGTRDVAVKGTSLRQGAVPAAGDYWVGLDPEPRNRADPCAVAVRTRWRRIGYLHRSVAAEYSGALIEVQARLGVRVHVHAEISDGATGRWALVWLPTVDEIRALLGD